VGSGCAEDEGELVAEPAFVSQMLFAHALQGGRDVRSGSKEKYHPGRPILADISRGRSVGAVYTRAHEETELSFRTLLHSSPP